MSSRPPSKLKQLLLRDQLWWRYYQRNADTIRQSGVDTIAKVLACGRVIMGYASFVCSNSECTHTKTICFGCKARLCNTCGKKLTDQWIANQKALLPDTEWQHITFTLPDVLWELFKLNRTLLGKLSPLAAKSLQTCAGEKGVTPGIFTALHTFGRKLNWNVHVHLSVTRGGLCDDNQQWKPVYFTKNAIMPAWRYRVINLLREAFKRGELNLPPDMKDSCNDLTGFNDFLNEQYQKGWIVHFAKATKSPHRTISYLGRYIKRPPLAMSRLKHYDGNTVVYEYLDHRTQTRRHETCEGEEVIERLTQHIPDKGFRMIRYYGFLACRARATLLPKVYNLLNQPERNAMKITFPHLLKQTFGVDPLQCILCQAQMIFTGITRGKPQRELYKYHQQLALSKPIA